MVHERRAHGSGPSFVLTPERNVSFAGLRGFGSLESTKDDPSFRPSERGELNFCLIPPAEAGRSSSSTCFLRSRRASLCWRSSRRGESFRRKLSRKRNRRSRAFRRVSMSRGDHHMEAWGGGRRSRSPMLAERCAAIGQPLGNGQC